MAERLDIGKRLRLLGINDDTKHNVALFRPVLEAEIGNVINRFHAHILTLPEAKKIRENQDIKGRLAPLQRDHWMRLFSCRFDAEYVRGALAVGQRHFDRGVAPYIYIGGYTYFHCELIQLASRHFARPLELANLLSALSRLVSLDMDLALSAYTREYWTQAKGAA